MTNSISLLTFKDSVDSTLKNTVVGTLAGVIYAKLSDFPLQQSAKAWAIYHFAISFFPTTVAIFGKTEKQQLGIRLGLEILVSAIGVHELQKRQLIGNKLIFFIAVSRILDCACAVFFNKDPKNMVIELITPITQNSQSV